MQDNDETLRRYYAARASEYERIFAKPERQDDLRELEHLFPTLLAGRRVLEIACGTGYWTQHIAKSAAHIVATDAVAEPLRIAAAKSLPAHQVRFTIADAYALPDSLGMFDGAFAGFWWSHVLLRDQPRFLQNLQRRLLPGARVVLLDNRFVPGSSTPISEWDAAGNSYQRRRLDDGSENTVLKNFPTEAQLRAAIGTAGHDIHYIALNYYWVLVFETAGEVL